MSQLHKYVSLHNFQTSCSIKNFVHKNKKNLVFFHLLHFKHTILTHFMRIPVYCLAHRCHTLNPAQQKS